MKKFKAPMLIGAAMGMSFAARFNAMMTPLHIAMALAEATPARKKGFRTGIKGMKSSNSTSYGAGLKTHFDRKLSKRAFV